MGNGISEMLTAIKPSISSRLQKAGLTKEQILSLSENIEKVYNAILGSLATNIKFRTKFFEDPLTAIKKYRKELSRYPGLGKVKRRASKKISGIPVERRASPKDKVSAAPTPHPRKIRPKGSKKISGVPVESNKISGVPVESNKIGGVPVESKKISGVPVEKEKGTKSTDPQPDIP